MINGSISFSFDIPNMSSRRSLVQKRSSSGGVSTPATPNDSCSQPNAHGASLFPTSGGVFGLSSAASDVITSTAALGAATTSEPGPVGSGGGSSDHANFVAPRATMHTSEGVSTSQRDSEGVITSAPRPHLAGVSSGFVSSDGHDDLGDWSGSHSRILDVGALAPMRYPFLYAAYSEPVYSNFILAREGRLRNETMKAYHKYYQWYKSRGFPDHFGDDERRLLSFQGEICRLRMEFAKQGQAMSAANKELGDQRNSIKELKVKLARSTPRTSPRTTTGAAGPTNSRVPGGSTGVGSSVTGGSTGLGPSTPGGSTGVGFVNGFVSALVSLFLWIIIVGLFLLCCTVAGPLFRQYLESLRVDSAERLGFWATSTSEIHQLFGLCAFLLLFCSSLLAFLLKGGVVFFVPAAATFGYAMAPSVQQYLETVDRPLEVRPSMGLGATIEDIRESERQSKILLGLVIGTFTSLFFFIGSGLVMGRVRRALAARQDVEITTDESLEIVS